MLSFIKRILFPEKKCDHRFDLEQVQDLNNDDPSCAFCKKRLSLITNGYRYRFDWDPATSKFKLVTK